MCEEYISAARHTGRGIRVNDNTMAVDTVDKIGSGGEYTSRKHTAKNLREEIWMSGIFNTSMWDKWEAKDKKDLYDLTEYKAKEISSIHHPE